MSEAATGNGVGRADVGDDGAAAARSASIDGDPLIAGEAPGAAPSGDVPVNGGGDVLGAVDARPSTRAMLANDAASAALGMRLERDEPGLAVVSMLIREPLLNGFGITHGGMVFALADTAFAIACNEDEWVTVAAGADIAFLAQTRLGQTLTATAVRRAVAGRTGVYDVHVCDETGAAVAEFRGRSVTTNRTMS